MTQPGTEEAVRAVALLDDPKRRRLYDYVAASHFPVSRDEAAAGLSMSRELAAFHLDQLAAAGLLETEYKRLGVRQGPGGGRPAKLYRRSDREVSVSVPPRDYERAAEVFADALDGLRETGVAVVADAGRVRGREAGLEARRKAETEATKVAEATKGAEAVAATGAGAVSALLTLLGDAGYEPEVAPDGAIRVGNCPYHAVAAGHRELTCGMNLAWAAGVLEGLGDESVTVRRNVEAGYCCIAFEPGTRGR